MDMEINFPNLGIYLNHVGKNISIFGFSIAYYGIVIVTGMMIAIWIAQREAKRTGQNPDQYLDLAMIGIAAGIAGARIYYVAFAWDYYKDDLLSIFNIRQGGLAIYGGIIGACIAVVIYSRKKKQSFGLLMDTASMSIVFGQIMGRWGNFFNREAFGDYTNNLFAMQLPVSAVRANEITQKMWDHVVTVNGVEYIQVHPTFLYESLWNVAVLLFLFWFRKRKKFNGEVFLMYLIGYGLGRIWIEGLRTDQLLLPVVGLPVSQLLSGCLVVFCTMIIVWKRKKIAAGGKTSHFNGSEPVKK
ncbi:prolipoprotein diacylglyceryl transferase [Fusicatenibacter sp.]